jgi:hypothetical protein
VNAEQQRMRQEAAKYHARLQVLKQEHQDCRRGCFRAAVASRINIRVMEEVPYSALRFRATPCDIARNPKGKGNRDSTLLHGRPTPVKSIYSLVTSVSRYSCVHWQGKQPSELIPRLLGHTKA